MPAPRSLDLREQIIKAVQSGGVTWQEVADRFDVGRASVDCLMRQLRETGEISPKPAAGGRESKIDDGGLLVLRECTAALGQQRSQLTFAASFAGVRRRRWADRGGPAS